MHCSMRRMICISAFVVSVAVAAGFIRPATALPAAPSGLATAIEAADPAIEVAARRARTARAGKVNVSRSRTVTRNRNVKVNRNRNVNVNARRHVVVRPVRPWVRRPWFGTVVAGVTIGTLIAATTVPAAPGPNLCWFWSDSSNTRGYWDYCTPPQ